MKNQQFPYKKIYNTIIIKPNFFPKKYFYINYIFKIYLFYFNFIIKFFSFSEQITYFQKKQIISINPKYSDFY